MNHPTRFLLAAFLFLAAPSLLLAGAPPLVNYQGVLTDDAGAIVPDGSYYVDFSVYADSVGGSPIWNEYLKVDVVDGVFSQILGETTPLTPALFNGTPRWMGISVESDPEMTPRTKITSVPWALRSAVADSAVVVGGAVPDADWTIDGDDMYAGVSGNVGVGTSAPLQTFHIVGEDTLGTLMIAPGVVTSGGDSEIRFVEDDNGTYGMFLRYDGSGNDLRLGGFNETTTFGPHAIFSRNSPVIEFQGGGGSALFSMNSTGNSAVILPSEAISSPEILDEAGAACSTWTGAVQAISTSPTILSSRSIQCPAAGYVLAFATAHLQWFVNSSNIFNCDFALSNQTTVMPDPVYTLRTSGDLPWGTYDRPVTIHGLFPVASAGTHTFYFLAEEQTSDFVVYDKVLTLLYVPTAYGNVSAALTAEGPANDPAAGAERAATERANAERLEREIAGLRAEIEEIRAEVRAEEDR